VANRVRALPIPRSPAEFSNDGYLGLVAKDNYHFRGRAIYMMVAGTVYLFVLVAFIVWRFVFEALRHRQLVQGMAAPRRENRFLGRVGVIAIEGGHFDDGSQRAAPFEVTGHAQTYLSRIVALTGATQSGSTFILDVGTTRFYVRDRHVKRLRNVIDPICEYEETCFNVPTGSIPAAEQIASVLLALKNNPALFDPWAAQIGAVKANGQEFGDA